MNGSPMRIEHDKGLSALIRSATVTRICTGFTFTEGPIWIPQDECLLFSDIPNNRIHRWRPGATEAEVYREPSQQSNGLTLDNAGDLLACEHFARRVTRAPYGGDATVVADRFEGQRFNSPNDIVVHSSGALYFTDPTYGLRDQAALQEQPVHGVYRLDPDGSLSRVEASFTQPNGLAFSPEETLLYIGDSQDKVIRRFQVLPNGTLSGGEIFVDMRADDREGVPDGMKVDEDGRLWTTGAGGVWVIAPGGECLGVLAIPEVPTNIAFGDTCFGSIYITAQTSVYRVETTIRGIAPGTR